jgi:hypothetical protein
MGSEVMCMFRHNLLLTCVQVYVIPFTRNSLNANATLAFNFGSINGRPHAVATNYQYTDVEA